MEISREQINRFWLNDTHMRIVLHWWFEFCYKLIIMTSRYLWKIKNQNRNSHKKHTHLIRKELYFVKCFPPPQCLPCSSLSYFSPFLSAVLSPLLFVLPSYSLYRGEATLKKLWDLQQICPFRSVWRYSRAIKWPLWCLFLAFV